MQSLRLLAASFLVASLVGCAPSPSDQAAESPPEPAAQAPSEPGVIDVKAEDYAFTAPPTFPSGWVRLRFDNQGAETHFLFILELPEGVTFGDYASQVSQPFDELYAQYRAGKLDQATFFTQLLEALPEWFPTARRAGGPGFTAPGRTSETAIYLEPGDYVMECYVRAMTEDDTFHGSHGMLRPLIVTEQSSGMPTPEADIEITLSNYTLSVEGDLSAGTHVARVRVEENPEGLIFHNVHLVKLDEDVTAEVVAPWLNWVDEMLPPAPAEFLGGAGQTTAGGESYVTVNLEPGRYAWVSEAYGVQGMLHEFTVE
jgi:hypothetical protein